MAALVEAENLVKIFPGKVTLYNFTLSIDEGGIFGLLGPNGAGKSTFIRILTGLESADSGKIMLYGKPLSKDSAKKIGVAPQENCIYPLLTCMENLLYFGSLYGVSGKKANENATKLLNDLGLAEKKNTRAGFLSGGMKRRLNLACALMHDPKLLILDEPTTGLDPTTRRNMWDVVKKLSSEKGTTVILTTHYMEEAEALCYRIAFVNSGQIVAEGSTEELKRMVGRQIAKVVSVPGDYESLNPLLKKIPGIENIIITEAGIVVEAGEVSSKVSEITRTFAKKGEKVVELSFAKPSLEDVFLKLTGAQLKKEAAKSGPKK